MGPKSVVELAHHDASTPPPEHRTDGDRDGDGDGDGSHANPTGLKIGNIRDDAIMPYKDSVPAARVPLSSAVRWLESDESFGLC